MLKQALNIIVVDYSSHGKKIEQFIIEKLPHLNIQQVRKLLRTGQVRVNSARVKLGRKIAYNEKIRIPPFLIPQLVLVEQESPVVMQAAKKNWLQTIIIYQDEHIIVINKPAGLAVQGGSKIDRQNIDDLFKDYAAACNIPRPHLVHRLDKDTAGVMVLAKNSFIAAKLSQEFHCQRIEKHYYAITYASLNNAKGVFEMSFEPLEKNSKRFSKDNTKDTSHVQKKKLFTQTYYEIIASSTHAEKKISLFKLLPKTGRKHQIRKHLSYSKCPIIGDKHYGLESNNSAYIQTKYMYLVAKRIQFLHPYTYQKMVFEIDFPDYFKKFIEDYELNCYDK